MIFLRLFLIPFLILLFTSPSTAKPIVIKFSHVVARDTPKGQAVEYFKELVEERSEGRIQVRIYPNATLYGDRAALQALQLNAIQMAAPSFSKFIDLVPQLQIFDLPFLFRDADHLHKVLDGDIGQSLLELTSMNQIRALSFWDNGFKQLTANRPLLTPEDATGLKVRIMSSRVLVEQFRALGANPQILPFSEVYAALQQGIVSAQENTLSNIFTKRFHLVQSDLTISNHGYLGYVLVTNDLFWNKLPDDLRQIVEQAIVETLTFSRETSLHVNTEALAKLHESGEIKIHYLSDEERAAWQKVMREIYPRFYDLFDPKLIESIQQ